MRARALFAHPPLARMQVSRSGCVGEEPGSLRPRDHQQDLHGPARKAERALRAPAVSVSRDRRGRPQEAARAPVHRGFVERGVISRHGQPRPPSLSRRVRVHLSPGFCLTPHCLPAGRSGWGMGALGTVRRACGCAESGGGRCAGGQKLLAALAPYPWPGDGDRQSRFLFPWGVPASWSFLSSCSQL